MKCCLLCSESAGTIAALRLSNNSHKADGIQLALLQGTTVETPPIIGVQLLCTLDCTGQYKPCIGYRTTPILAYGEWMMTIQ